MFPVKIRLFSFYLATLRPSYLIFFPYYKSRLGLIAEQ